MVKKPKLVHRERIPSQYRPKRPNITQYRVKNFQKESDSGSDSVYRDSISSNEPTEDCQYDSACSLDATEFRPLLCSTTTQIMFVENFQAEIFKPLIRRLVLRRFPVPQLMKRNYITAL